MTSAVAFCPQAPVLVPDLARGAAPELEELRAACRTAIRRLAAPGRQLVVLGGGERNASFEPSSRGSFAGFGLDLEVSLGSDEPGPTELPPSLTVGAWLLRDALGPGSGAVGHSVGDPAALPTDWEERHGDDVGVLVLGDGSARRSLKAPGYLDERAGRVDAWIAETLGAGKGWRLHRSLIDDDDELLISGLAVWDELSWTVEPVEWEAELLYDGAPYGVGYFVASWLLDRSSVRTAHLEMPEGASWTARIVG
ncbi:hypothetical protein [uncultured Jatrophihabitans sp.]|uniref:hypothetical protein n=1 Tax=uncultured Jatrophihabitans sp. TaxID=1610747 RepID=UPI0035CA6CE1